MDKLELGEGGRRRWCRGGRAKAMKGEKSRGGRQKVSVTVTESDTELRPKLIACLLISPANDCHSLSQNGRERNPYSSVFNFYFLNNDPYKVFKYGGEQSDLLCDNQFGNDIGAAVARGPAKKPGLRLKGCWFESSEWW